MTYAGLDVGDACSSIAILNGDGKVCTPKEIRSPWTKKGIAWLRGLDLGEGETLRRGGRHRRVSGIVFCGGGSGGHERTGVKLEIELEAG